MHEMAKEMSCSSCSTMVQQPRVVQPCIEPSLAPVFTTRLRYSMQGEPLDNTLRPHVPIPRPPTSVSPSRFQPSPDLAGWSPSIFAGSSFSKLAYRAVMKSNPGESSSQRPLGDNEAA